MNSEKGPAPFFEAKRGLAPFQKTAVFLIGFGGPENSGEVRPFLESVLHGVRIPQERFDSVLSHYKQIGNVSPYNAIACAQRDALEKWFKEKGVNLPVFVGFRHALPSFRDVFLELKQNRFEKVIGFVLSPLRSYASYEKYIERVEEAKREIAADIRVKYVEPFSKNAFFLEAQSERVEEAFQEVPAEEREKAFFLFTAHSIPAEMSAQSGYAGQFAEASSAVARRLGLKFWDIAYQSRSGDPRQPWLEPDVKEAVRKINAKMFKHVVVVPIGFLSDNAEVLYDLDVELAQEVRDEGLHYFRASTVMDHPRFIQMMGEQILAIF
ncbi:MAG: ferrochelatase [Candidatus Omnitrophota bacterium]